MAKATETLAQQIERHELDIVALTPHFAIVRTYGDGKLLELHGPTVRGWHKKNEAILADDMLGPDPMGDAMGRNK